MSHKTRRRTIEIRPSAGLEFQPQNSMLHKTVIDRAADVEVETQNQKWGAKKPQR